MKRHMNCWFAAMWFWVQSWGLHYAWIRRSHAFKGMFVHFGFAERMGWRYLKIIEYIPPHNQRWTKKDMVFSFEGTYRVWHLRLYAVRRFASREQAMADKYWAADTR